VKDERHDACRRKIDEKRLACRCRGNCVRRYGAVANGPRSTEQLTIAHAIDQDSRGIEQRSGAKGRNDGCGIRFEHPSVCDDTGRIASGAGPCSGEALHRKS